MSDGQADQDGFLDAVGRIGASLLNLLSAMETVARLLHPPRIAELRAAVAPLRAELEQARAAFEASPTPDGLEPVAASLEASVEAALRSAALFVDEGDSPEAIHRVLGAMRADAEAQALLFPLADFLPPVHRFFLEPAVRELRPLPVPSPEEGDRRVGLFRAANGSDQRGGFTLFVPPEYDAARAWPIVVALHGGSGHGADFLWTWLREARSRAFLLLAPTSVRSTWSLGPEDEDGPNLRRQLEWVAEQWRVDHDRVLLTGLSDGATYTLLEGLAEGAPWTALAPVSGVFHPMNFVNGNLERARGRRIHLVHGALDWMFPVATAREAAAVLEGAGADLVFNEIEDLSHTYPREHNDAILRWFDPSLALPPAGASDASGLVD